MSKLWQTRKAIKGTHNLEAFLNALDKAETSEHASTLVLDRYWRLLTPTHSVPWLYLNRASPALLTLAQTPAVFSYPIWVGSTLGSFLTSTASWHMEADGMLRLTSPSDAIVLTGCSFKFVPLSRTEYLAYKQLRHKN